MSLEIKSSWCCRRIMKQAARLLVYKLLMSILHVLTKLLSGRLSAHSFGSDHRNRVNNVAIPRCFAHFLASVQIEKNVLLVKKKTCRSVLMKFDRSLWRLQREREAERRCVKCTSTTSSACQARRTFTRVSVRDTFGTRIAFSIIFENFQQSLPWNSSINYSIIAHWTGSRTFFFVFFCQSRLIK